MLNPKKVEMSSRLAAYEHGKGQAALLLRKDYEGKGIRRHWLKNILCGMFGFLCIAALLYFTFGYRLIDFSENFVLSGLIVILTVLVGIVFTAIYSSLVFRFGEKRYKNIRSSLVRYDIIKKNTERNG